MYKQLEIPGLAQETLVVSLAYVMAFGMTHIVLMPVQGMWFPEFSSRASLLFLPHGVRVLSAWLLGWRSAVALLPGVIAVFIYVAGAGAFAPSRLAAISVAVIVPAAVFHVFTKLKLNLSPSIGTTPCWSCVLAAGVVISVLTSLLTNWAFGSASEDYVAYLIGDVFGLFFLMLFLMLVFRTLSRRG